MAEALEKVKKTLGPHAVILNTRTLRRGGVLGVGSKSLVEITATRDQRALPVSERRAIIGRKPASASGAASARGDQDGRGLVPPAEGTVMARRAGDNASVTSQAQMAAFTSVLRDEMNELRGMVRELLDRPSAQSLASTLPNYPEGLQEYYTLLLQNEVAEEIARELMAEARDRLRGWQANPEDQAQARSLRELVPEVLTECIERMLPAAEPIQLDGQSRPKYVALIGPTGVGKTTTVAKLAAHFKLRENKRVGLITIDTYRIAAVEQLRTYADILSIPLQVVMTPQEMAAAVAETVDCDLVLIDTSGRSQRDERRLQELDAFLKAARQASLALAAGQVGGKADALAPIDRAQQRRPRGPDGRFLPRPAARDGTGSFEAHLVLSCTGHRAQLLDAAERFGALGVDRVVFTKLDEAVGLGVILNVIRRLNIELSYLSTGQDVPDDIEIGHRRRIAELILGRAASPACPIGRGVAATPAVDFVA